MFLCRAAASHYCDSTQRRHGVLNSLSSQLACLRAACHCGKHNARTAQRLATTPPRTSTPSLYLRGTGRIDQPSRIKKDAIEHFEVNEAFAAVPLAWQKEFGVDPAHLNPIGGAIALGHPLGASGARLMTTMLNAMERSGARYGLQTMCEAGGMANATIIERL